MKKLTLILIFAWVSIFGLILPAAALKVSHPSGQDTNIKEDYKAQSLSGSAVVDLDSGEPIWFDRVVTLDSKDVKKNLELVFHVIRGLDMDVDGKITKSNLVFDFGSLNNSGETIWFDRVVVNLDNKVVKKNSKGLHKDEEDGKITKSDYQYVFDFDNLDIKLKGAQSSTFKDVDVIGNKVDFSGTKLFDASGIKIFDPGDCVDEWRIGNEMHEMRIALDTSHLTIPKNKTVQFSLRQIATATHVPLPGAILLLGAGLFRLAAHARRRKE